MVVGFEAEVLGARIPVDLEGSLVLRNGELRFEPARLEVFGRPVPRRLTRALLRKADFSYPIAGEPPVEGTFSDVEVYKDRIDLFGEVEGLPVE